MIEPVPATAGAGATGTIPEPMSPDRPRTVDRQERLWGYPSC